VYVECRVLDGYFKEAVATRLSEEDPGLGRHASVLLTQQDQV